MKKVLVVFILLLLAVPAMATITVTATCTGSGANATVTVSYATTGETLPPRAFGLLISCDANGVIGTVSPVTTNYYVAPGTFDYNSTSGVVAWGNPVVSKTGNSFILEVGSLYATNDAQHPSAPSLSGTLLTFPMTVASGKATVSIAVDSARGGVVREDPSVTGNITLTPCSYTNGGQVLCFPSTSNYAKQMSDFKAYKSYNPSWDGACWCGTVVSTKWKYQCDGDFDGTTETLSKYRIYNNDYGAVTANWKKKISDANPCADYDHASETLSKYRVYNNDYGKITTNWKKKDSNLPGNCPRPDGQN